MRILRLAVLGTVCLATGCTVQHPETTEKGVKMFDKAEGLL